MADASSHIRMTESSSCCLEVADHGFVCFCVYVDVGECSKK